jgi:hypothetical protein
MKKDKVKTWWSEGEINDLEIDYLHQLFNCDTQEGVDAAYFYSRFLAKRNMTPDNYPIFIKLLGTGNHWIIDSLVGETKPEDFFKVIQPNSFIITSFFEMIKKWKSGEIYDKLLLVILGILNTAYENPEEGFKIYPLSPEEINQIGKQLNKELGQKDPVNRNILHLLDRLSDLMRNLPVDRKTEVIATHASKIRGKFLDESMSLDEAIPPELLVKGDYKTREIKPSMAT